MKEKKLNGYTIGIIIILFMFLCYWGSCNSLLRRASFDGDASYFSTLLATINVVINIVIVGFIPVIIRLISKDIYRNNVIVIYIINGIISIFLSMPVYKWVLNDLFGFEEMIETGNIGAVGSLIFSIAIYNLMRGKESYKKIKEGKQEQSKEKNESNINQMYDDLQKLKKLLDDQILTEEEFEKEKKRILNK